MRYLRAIILLAFLGAVGVFALQNTQAVTITLFSIAVTAPLALVIVAIYLVGMLTGGAVWAFLRRSIRRISEHPKELNR